MSAQRGAAASPGGDPEDDAEDRDVRRVRGALERLADELGETSETIDRALEELDDGAPGDDPER